MPVFVASAIGLAFLLLLVWGSARAAITIAVAEIRDGKLEITRGGLAPRVLGDLRDGIALSALASRAPAYASSAPRIGRAWRSTAR